MSATDRLKYLGIIPDNYKFSYSPAKIETWNHAAKSFKQEDEHLYLKDNQSGDIEIFYPSVNDAGIQYFETEKSFDLYRRIRHAKPNEHNGIKYLSPKKSGVHIFFPRNTLIKAREKQKIQTLFIVEGEFKAIYADFFGIDCLGIGGIHMFIEKKEGRYLHPDIVETVKNCKVETLVLITDADSRHVNFDWVYDPNKDLGERLFLFADAVEKFKNACHKYNEDAEINNDIAERIKDRPVIDKLKYYWLHIREQFVEEAKGLDDLFVFINDHEKIISDLNKLARAKEYFNGYNLSDFSRNSLLETFWLDADKQGFPTHFYNHFDKEIQERQFWFLGNLYQFDTEKKVLNIKHHKDLNSFIRVGVQYYRKIIRHYDVLTKENKTITIRKKSLEKWNRTEIVEDYVKRLGLKHAFNMIPKFTSFANIAGHHEQYKNVIGEEFNLYHSLPYDPAPGSWETTKKYLEHISKNEFQDKFDVLIDMLYLKYTNPIIKLPVVVLYSPEMNTGKSTFLFWLDALFGSNANLISNKDLDDQFNEYLLGNVLLLDEAIINEKAAEMIKTACVSNFMSIRMMYAPAAKLPFFGTFFLTTNKLQFVQVDESQDRYMILRVPVLKNNLDPNILEKMKDEIPAFVYYLKNEHKMRFPQKKARFWFQAHDMATETLTELKKRSQKMVFKAIKEWAKNFFHMYKIEEFEHVPVLMTEEIREYSSRNISANEISNCLKDDLNLKPEKVKRFSLPKIESCIDENMRSCDKIEWENSYIDKKGRKKYYTGSTYCFQAKEILDEADYLDLVNHISGNE